jgi:hypothetical protein
MATTLMIFGAHDADLPSSAFARPGMDGQGRSFLAFAGATADESAYFVGIAPQGMTGTATLIVTYRMASATTGSVRFEALVEAITDADAVDTDSASSFDTTNSAGATVPGTAGYIDQLSITLTNKDSIAAGDYFRIQLRRDQDGTTGTDDATGDAQVLAVELQQA